MPLIYVCPKSQVPDAAERLRPSHLITLLDPTDEMPTPEGILAHRHLKLGLNDIVQSLPDHGAHAADPDDHCICHKRRPPRPREHPPRRAYARRRGRATPAGEARTLPYWRVTRRTTGLEVCPAAPMARIVIVFLPGLSPALNLHAVVPAATL